MNSIGQLFKVSSFGESHGPVIGVIIDGCPAGLNLDYGFIQSELDRRKPGQSNLTTQRKEEDLFEIVSGVFENKTTGAPITIIIKNKDSKSEDYAALKDVYRPSHADFTYEKKYGHRDYRGGGRSSARITAGWVAAGAVAKLLMAHTGIHIQAYVKQIYNIKLNKAYDQLDFTELEESTVRCPDKATSLLMEAAVLNAKNEGDSLGGIIACVLNHVPIGLGEPVFDKLNAKLAHAMMSINAVKGIQFGLGFDMAERIGSEMNDEFVQDEAGLIGTSSNHSGGIQGGISNGEPIYFETAFKPVATIGMVQNTVNKAGEAITLEAKGRHDPCVLPRAVPIVEAMAALVLMDCLLLQKAYSL